MTGRQTLDRLFGYAKPYRSRLAWAVAGMVVYATGSAGLAYLIKPIIDSGLDKRPDAAASEWGMAAIAWGIVLVYLLKGIGSYVSSFLMADVGQRVVMDLRNALYRHILNQSAGFFANSDTGQLLSLINNDVGQVQQVVSETIGDLARESLALVGYVGILFWYDPLLAIISLVFAPLVVYPLVRLGQRVRRTARRSQEALGHISHISAEGFTGHRIVKAFGTEQQEGEKFSAAGYHLFRTNMKVTAALSSLPPLMEFIGGLGMAAAVWLGSGEIAAGRLTAGSFGSFMGSLLLMYGPAKKLSRVNASLQQAIASSERIFGMLDTHTEVTERPGAPALAPFQESIEFRDVTFGYEKDATRILRGVSFDVRAGQMVAIVGRSGAGKTTLVNLLPRFYDVSSGGIFIDGVDIRHVTLASLRRQVGIVTQDTVLFDDTVANNISYGSAGASRQMIEAAARAAHAHEFVGLLDKGLRHAHRRARAAAVGRPAPAAGDRARAPQERPDSGPRRGHVGARHRIGAPRAGGARESDDEPDIICDRAPAVDDSPRRCDHRARARPRGRRSDATTTSSRVPGGAYAKLYQMQLLEGRKAERRVTTP